MPAISDRHYSSRTSLASRFRHGLNIVVATPAYNAVRTLERTIADIPHDIVSEIILVDDCSGDTTVEVGKSLNLSLINHPHNVGYGGSPWTVPIVLLVIVLRLRYFA